MFVLALLLMVMGAVTAAYLVNRMDQRIAVIMVTRDVPVGTQISVADVATTRVAVDARVVVIPGRQLRQVVGRIAAMDLRKGSLLAASQLTDSLVPGPGQQVVPVAVKLDQLPARGLRPGDQVLVVATPGDQGQDQTAISGGSALNQDTPARVNQVSSPDADGNVRVDLVVAAQVGSAIAKQASTGRIGFVLTPPASSVPR